MSVVKYGMSTFRQNNQLLIEIIVRESLRQLERKCLSSLTVADEVRFIFNELNLKIEEK